MQRGQLDEAIAHYRKALEIKPDYAEAHNNLGNALASRGQVDEAIAHYQKALEIKPDYAEAHNNLGMALASRGQVDEAIAQYRKALEIKPDLAEAHNNLGMALHQQGKVSDAVAHWREAARLQPSQVIPLNQLAWVLATCPEASIRNGAEAVELARRAVELTGGREPAVLGTLAAAYAEAGRFSEAVEAAERAVSLASARGDQAMTNILRRPDQALPSRFPVSRDSQLATWKELMRTNLSTHRDTVEDRHLNAPISPAGIGRCGCCMIYRASCRSPNRSR